MDLPGKKNILLVNPWIMDFKAYDFWIKPLGLLYIAAILEKNGYGVNFIDCIDRLHPSVKDKIRFKEDGTGKFYSTRIEKPALYEDVPRKYRRYGIDPDEFLNETDRIPKPDLILVTSIMTYWYRGVHYAIKLLKERFPGTPIILGGIYATLCPEFASKNSGAHHVISRFDPVQFLDLVGELTDTKPGFKPKCFAEFPSPAFHLYSELNYGIILSSRGCPYRCSYCASGILSPDFYQRNVKNVLNELTMLNENFGIKKFAFYDDALLINGEKHIIPLLKSILKNDVKFNFFTPNGLHARFITKELAKLMYETGFGQLRLSLESSDAGFLQKTGGKVTSGETAKGVEYLREAGFDSNDIGIYLMMGLPGQSFEECEKSIDYVHSLGVQIRLSDYSPVPGTIDYYRALEVLEIEPGDPLYHNNTYHHYREKPFSHVKKKYLKEKTFHLNGELM